MSESQESTTRLDVTDISPEQRNLLLLRCEENGKAAGKQLDQIEDLFDHMLGLAQDCFEDADSALEVACAALRVYDDESERLLADTQKRVRSLEARLRHLKQDIPAPGTELDPEFVAALESELEVAKADDQALISSRLANRQPLSARAHAARREVLDTGTKVLSLASRMAPALAEIQQKGEEAAQLRNRSLKAEGKLRLQNNEGHELVQLLARDPEAGMPERRRLHLVEGETARATQRRLRRHLGGADVHADGFVARTVGTTMTGRPAFSGVVVS